LPVRLNLFSALCSALAVTLLYRLMAFLVRRTIDDLTINDRQADLAAMLAGLTSAAALAFCVPFWAASTRLQYQGFDLLLALAIFYLLVWYVRTGWLIFVLLFAFCYGVGVVEATLFLSLAPIAGAAALFVLWMRRRLKRGIVFGMGLLLLLGLGAYVLFATRFFLTEDIALRGYTSWQDVLIFMWRDQAQELMSAFPRLNWFWLLLQSVVPGLAVVLAARRALNNERSWSQYLLHLILTVLVVFVLTNVPWSPWRLVEEAGILPVTSYAIMAMVSGYLLAYWYLLAVVKETRRDQKILSLTKSAGKWMGRVLACVLALVVVAWAVVNAFEADGHRGKGADACARALLQRMGSRTWIVTDGLLDNHIAILARVKGQKIHLLCLQHDLDKVYQRRLTRIIERENMFPNNRTHMLDTLELGIRPFLQDWLANDPDAANHLVIFSVPDLWYGAGLAPIPDLLFFSGAHDTTQLNLDALVADHLALWNRMEKIVPRTAQPVDPMASFNNQLRRQMGFVGNNLGVLLEENGRTNEADSVYQRVRQLDPDNISVLFNRFELARRLKDEKMSVATENDLKDFLARDKGRQYGLYALSQYYGYVRNPLLFARLGWQWALSGQSSAAIAGMRKAGELLPPSEQIVLEQSMASLYLLQDNRIRSEETYRNILEKDPGNRVALRAMAHLALSAGALEKAKNWLEKLQKAGMTQNQLGVEWASIYLASGETAFAATNLAAATASFAHARMQLVETVDVEPSNLQALGMLAVVELKQAGVERADKHDPMPFFKDVEQTIDKMTKVAGSPDQYFIQIVKAQLALAKGRDFYRAAREAFIRASILRPEVQKLNDVILKLDIDLADTGLAERHASGVLRVNPRSALANYVIGSLRLQAGEYSQAEDFLRRSVEVEPLPAALNDLAEALRRLHKYGEAEKFAREATVQSPDLYVAWETLASTLMDENRLTEAETAMNEAIRRSKDDARMQVSMTRLQYLKGDFNRAREAIKLVRKNLDQLSASERAEFEKLAAEVAKH